MQSQMISDWAIENKGSAMPLDEDEERAGQLLETEAAGAAGERSSVAPGRRAAPRSSVSPSARTPDSVRCTHGSEVRVRKRSAQRRKRRGHQLGTCYTHANGISRR